MKKPLTPNQITEASSLRGTVSRTSNKLFKSIVSAIFFGAGITLQVSNAAAQTTPSTDPMRVKADALLSLLNGEGEIPEHFHPLFLREVPQEKLQGILTDMSKQYGKAVRITSLEKPAPNQAVLMVEYDRAVVRIEMAIADTTESHLISGLYFTQAQVQGDNIQNVVREIGRLPGKTAFGIWKTNGRRLTLTSGHRPNEPMAVGSTFKLVILAALDEEIKRGKRRWSDVVPLTKKSLPSGQMQHWPNNAPISLHTLATMMISISDNTATDTLLELLGRQNVTRFEQSIGIMTHRQSPMLSTIEFFVLKEDAQTSLRNQWISGNYSSRLRLLENNKKLWRPSNAGHASAGATPAHIDKIEWFYAPSDIASIMNWFAIHGSPQAKSILGVSPGMSGADRQNWSYVGYKGGSETGVISMNYLLISKNGEQYIISGSWNNPSKAVDDNQFHQYMARAAGILSRR